MFFNKLFKKKEPCTEIDKPSDKINKSLDKTKYPFGYVDYNRLYNEDGQELTDHDIIQVRLKNGQRYLYESRVYTKDELAVYQKEEREREKEWEKTENRLFKAQLEYLGLLK